MAGPPHGEVDYELAGRRYRELLEMGLEMGVRPAMEYLGFAQQVNSIADALDIMERSGHPEATIVLDPFHDFRGGAGHEDIARLRPEQIAVCHFDDAPAEPPASEQRDPDRVLPGEGVIDLPRFVTLLRQVGYSGWVSLELFREDLWQRDPEEVPGWDWSECGQSARGNSSVGGTVVCCKCRGGSRLWGCGVVVNFLFGQRVRFA